MADGQMIPFERTPLARAMLVWAGLSFIVAPTFSFVGEALPDAPVMFLVTALVLFPLPLFAVWALVAFAKRPRRDWRAPLYLAVASTIFALAFGPLLVLGARMHLQMRHETYEGIVSDARAGRLPPNADGVISGRRRGASYLIPATNPSAASFSWGFVPGGFFGVTYDQSICVAHVRPKDTEPAPQARPDGASTPTIKNAGQLSGPHWPLSDRACLLYLIW